MKKIIAIALLMTAACQNADPDRAQKYANEFIGHIPGATSASCAKSDSDGDGYISCTVFVTGEEPTAIDCGAENWCIANCAEGCRMTVLRPVKVKR